MSGTDTFRPPGWRLDQVASAGRENLDAQHVARYDAIEDASPDREVALLQQWGLSRESVVVELGTGTGQFAVAAAHVFDRVIAADVSPVMIAELRAKLARERVDNVDVVQAGFLDYEHEGAPADIVYSRYALHHLPDFWKGVALARIHRTLRPGGLLRVWDVVYSFEPHEAEDRLEAWCATGGPDGGDGWSRADYEEHVRDEHSTFTWVFEALAQRAGFHVETAEYSSDGIFAEYLFRKP
ncbi:class I SAM-dependent methyltransferase [Jannaschia sp. R86511]|uniref:class I SAM-dependent methyltransferase n=1 Tax=Jannaschia sp. R86511 TaxID=3093853 RepID=UPI0036D42D57